MSASTSVLFDDLGPRGRRQVRFASIAVLLLVVGLAVVVGMRLYDTGQLEQRRWETLTQWAVLRFLLVGMWTTIKIAAAAMVLSLLVGIVMALGRLAQNRPVRWLSGVYVELFRAVPLLLLILFSFYVFPQYLSRYGIQLGPFWYLVAGLTLYNSAVLAEIFRAGILSLDRGQKEAATALGLTYWQSMRFVIIPQAGRRMIPSILSQLIALFKDTSLGFYIGLEDALRRARILGEFGGNLLQAYIAIALMYFVICYALSRLVRRLETRQRRRFKAAPIDVIGVEAVADVAASERAR